MTELERYKKALEKISQYGIKPTSETELQRIKRLKSIADKALFLTNISEHFSPIDKNDPTFEILFRDGNWSAYDSQLTGMMREIVIRYNKLVEHLNAR